MSDIDSTYNIFEWNDRINKIYRKIYGIPESENGDGGYKMVALTFFIAGLILGIVLIEYVVPWIMTLD